MSSSHLPLCCYCGLLAIFEQGMPSTLSDKGGRNFCGLLAIFEQGMPGTLSHKGGRNFVTEEHGVPCFLGYDESSFEKKFWIKLLMALFLRGG